MGRRATFARKYKSTSVRVNPSDPRPRVKKYGSEGTKRPKKDGVLDLTCNEEPNEFRFVVNDEQMRTCIATYFVQVLDPLDEWHGVDGLISIIQRELKIPSGSRDMIQKVLTEVMQAHKRFQACLNTNC